MTIPIVRHASSPRIDAGPTDLALPLAAAAGSAAFARYAWRFGPWLCAPRTDGRDG